METCNESKPKRKRNFLEAWLSNDRYKSWIRQVPSDNSVYHCMICNKTYSCSSFHVSKHVNSACHKKNNNENVNNIDISTINKQGHHKRKFRPQWLDIKQFQPWLREVPTDVNSVYCSICDRSFLGGLSKIYQHAESKKHKDSLEKHDIEANKWNDDLNTQVDESLLSFDERKKAAEIRFATLITERNIPHQTAKDILTIFQQIGDQNVLKNMSMGHTKCQKIISNVLCPVETERVVDSIQNTKFSIFIDETSDLTNKKWLTFLVRYVDSETLDLRTQLVKLIDIDASDCSAQKLFNAFEYDVTSCGRYLTKK